MTDDPRIAEAIALVNEQTSTRIWEFMVAGAFAAELVFEWEPPTVTHSGSLVTVSENLRFI